MSNRSISASGAVPGSRHLKALAILAVFSTCVYGVVALLSWEFDFDRPGAERPIVPVLVLFAAAFAAYLFAIRVATRAAQDRRLLTIIVWPAVVFRVVLLFSVPIQEIDIYRYLWDGAVSTAGVSPFQFSPDQVRLAARSSTPDADLGRVIRILDREPAMVEILRRIHFGELPTIYPRVSQAVFAASEFTAPENSSLASHVFIMKSWLVGFDLATLLLVVGLLKLCQKPIGLCLIYVWCPLLLKEVANSGHLDAVAVFFSTLAIYLAVRLLIAHEETNAATSSAIVQSCGVAIVLSLAVGAKLYPVVLAPLLFVVFVRRIGLVRSLIPVSVFVAVTLWVLGPILPRDSRSVASAPRAAAADAPATPLNPPAIGNDVPRADPSLGVATFLRRREMNDFIFLLIVENLKPTSQLTPDHTAWFSVLPDNLRQRIIAYVTAWADVAETFAPWFAWLAVETFLSGRRKLPIDAVNPPSGWTKYDAAT